jgi:hypothetical protein
MVIVGLEGLDELKEFNDLDSGLQHCSLQLYYGHNTIQMYVRGLLINFKVVSLITTSVTRGCNAVVNYCSACI